MGQIAVGDHRLELLPDGGQFLDRVDADVARARRRVLVECYIVRDDQLGRWLGERLVAARARGLDVRLVYDPLGSQKADPAFFDRLRQAGVGALPYWAHHRGLPRFAPFPRDHGRVIAIDDVGYTGGAAWADEWLPAPRGGQGWYDVSVRVDGPIADDFAALFELRWAEASRQRHGASDFDTAGRHPELRLTGDTPSRDSLVYLEHAAIIRAARRRVWLANAYFYPPGPLLDDLTAAVDRGVDVRVLVPRGSDLPIVERAARAEQRDWLDRGLRLFEYGPPMMHAKIGVVDDRWSTVGSFNALPVSVGLANEVNLFVASPDFVAVVAAEIDRIVAQASEVTEASLTRRSIWTQVADDAASQLLRLTDLIWGPRR